MATLVLQGLTMPVLIRRLGVGDDGASDEEELRARLTATTAALARIDELAAEDWTRPDTVDRMRAAYAWRKRRFAARAGRIEDDGYEEQSAAYQRTLREVLDAQRRAVVEMRNRGEISNDVMHQNRARARPRGLAARGAARLWERRRVPGLLRPPATTSARGSGYGVAASWKSEMACVTSGTRA
jgi:hypothetical protein